MKPAGPTDCSHFQCFMSLCSSWFVVHGLCKVGIRTKAEAVSVSRVSASCLGTMGHGLLDLCQDYSAQLQVQVADIENSKSLDYVMMPGVSSIQVGPGAASLEETDEQLTDQIRNKAWRFGRAARQS